MKNLELIIFENDADKAQSYIDLGVNSCLVDFEVMGKDLRQLGFDTEINPGTLDDLSGIAGIEGSKTWCRINRYGDHTKKEIEAVIGHGAKVVVLPMVKTLSEVDSFIRLINQRCEAAIMIETVEAAEISRGFNGLPIDYVYFGLNDYAISKGNPSIFHAVADGSVEKVRSNIFSAKFGIAGATSVKRGYPIPSEMIIEELERLECDLTFLRRSFKRDLENESASEILNGIQLYWETCCKRSQEKRHSDHLAFIKAVYAL